MKILILLPKLTNSGPPNVVASLINSPEYQKHELILCSFLGEDQEYIDKIAHQKIKTVPLNGFNLKSLRALRKIIKTEKVDVLHSHCLLPDIASPLVTMFTPCKTISTIHCDLHADYSKEYPPIKAKIYYAIHNLYLLFIKQKVSVSQGVSDKLLLTSKVIYNGVKQRFIKKQENKENTIHLIFAGRLIARKNILFLLGSFKEIEALLQQNIILHIYGDGELFDEAYKYHSEKIIMHGFCNDFIGQSPENSIFINPSLAEGMPMVVLEAIAAGIPVALSAIPPHLEIKTRIKSGVEVFEFTHESISQAINRLLTETSHVNFDQTLMMEGFNEYFSNTQMSHSYLNIYETL